MHVRTLVGFLALSLLWVGCDSGGSDEEGTLEIIDLTAGTGERVGLGLTLIVSYEGRLEDGTVFDSTEERGESWIFTMIQGQVIEGWIEGLLDMQVGGTRRLIIPPHLAFGRQGRCLSDGTCPVPPNSTVIYDVTVEDILDDVLIEEVAEGVGEVADNGRLIAVSYVGTFLDGQVFDSSEFTGQPFIFVLGARQVIEGWDRGLIGMKEGGVRNLTIPPHLAYGATGIPGSIPPFTTLRFRVELLDVASDS